MAFNGCTALKTVNVESTLTVLNICAFDKCGAITSGTFGTIKWALDSTKTMLSFTGTGDMMDFMSGTGSRPWDESANKITKVTLSEGIISIGDCAFFSCSNLQSVIIPASVLLIGNNAFGKCPQWDYGIFGGISWMFDASSGKRSFTGKGNIPEFYANGTPWDKVRLKVKTVVIGKGITSIGDYAFFGCKNLGSVTIPSTLTAVGINANVDEALLTGEIRRTARCGPDCVATFSDDELVLTGNGRMTNFPEASNTPWLHFTERITSVDVKAGITSIGSYSFQSFSRLTSVSLPQSLTSIEASAFQGCVSLTSVMIPEGVALIRKLGFSGCTLLKSVSLPNSLRAVEADAFADCSSLISITIPVGVVKIGHSAFKPVRAIYYNGVASPSDCRAAFNEEKATAYVTRAYTDSVFCMVPIVYSDEYDNWTKWTFDESDMSLHITGENKINIDGVASTAPWSRFSGKIIKIVVDVPLVQVTKATFDGYPLLTELYAYLFVPVPQTRII